jgi:hypothetical protein
MQTVDFLFEPAEDEPGFLEVRVQLMRESGEANIWRRINKNFLHEIRRQLLVWRSFDNPSKEKYELRLMAAEKKISDHKQSERVCGTPLKGPGVAL